MPKPSEVLVYIDADGSARELSEAEKNYVDAEFSPFDGARPYIKSRYWERTACSALRGYLHRQEVPIGIPIGPAPPVGPSPHTPQTAADSIIGLIRKHSQE